jgi:hypothetical protein
MRTSPHAEAHEGLQAVHVRALPMLISGGGAALLYGAWGFWANHDFGLDAAARAATVQAVWSFAFTLLLSGVVEVSVAHTRRVGMPKAFAAMPPLLLVWVGPVSVHASSGTPELARTVAPGVAIGTIFVLVYLRRAARSGSHAAGAPLRLELVDVAALRQMGSPAAREALALRIFALWQPIFSHLDGLDYTFHLHKHVEDESASRIRALFGVDAEGSDRALVIVRVHEHDVGGRTWARLTINAGVDRDLVGTGFAQPFIASEIWRYRLRHPLRPFFVVDAVVSEASYCAYAKYFSGLAPAPGRPIPESWWAVADAGGRALGGEPVTGERPEIRRFTAIVRDAGSRADVSRRSQEAARFYRELTGGREGVGVLVIAPLSFHRYTVTFTRFLASAAWNALPPNKRGSA